MTPQQVADLQNVFDPTQLLSIFMQFGTYILAIVAVIIAIGLVRWGYRKIRGLLSRGV